jgi:hypothetical protein
MVVVAVLTRPPQVAAVLTQPPPVAVVATRRRRAVGMVVVAVLTRPLPAAVVATQPPPVAVAATRRRRAAADADTPHPQAEATAEAVVAAEAVAAVAADPPAGLTAAGTSPDFSPRDWKGGALVPPFRQPPKSVLAWIGRSRNTWKRWRAIRKATTARTHAS